MRKNILTETVRIFFVFELVKNDDETDKRFVLDFLRFAGGGGICAKRPLFIYTCTGLKNMKDLAPHPWLMAKTVPGALMRGSLDGTREPASELGHAVREGCPGNHSHLLYTWNNFLYSSAYTPKGGPVG